MKRVLRWVKAAWLWVFADVRTEMRRRETPHEGTEDEDE